MKQTDLLVVNFIFTVVRILVIIVISFYMTRILVNQLGLELFGLFTTIGASGMLLGMFTNILQISIAREMGLRVGEKKSKNLRIAFSSSFFIQLFSGLLVAFLGITFSGYITKGLTIPEGYENVTWICLILTFIQFSFGIIVSPFAAIIRAHQHLRTITILEMLSKISIFCCVLFMITYNGDKLLFFVVANLVVFFFFQVIHVIISLRRFPEAHPDSAYISKDTTISIFRYASLALLGGIGGQIRKNGIAIMLNILFGNFVTAANGIAIRLSNLIGQFVGTISPVIQPAMNANQGAGNNKYINRLIPLSSTIGLSIIIPVAMPLFFDTESILLFWLQTDLPEYTILFSQITTATFLVSMVSKGHGMALHAHGNIGWLTFVNQILVIVFIFCGAYVCYNTNSKPWMLPVGELVGLVLATSFWQPFWVSKKLGFPNHLWFKYTIVPAVLFLISNILLIFVLSQFMQSSPIRAVTLGLCSCMLCFSILWIFGFQKTDRSRIINMIQSLFNKYKFRIT